MFCRNANSFFVRTEQGSGRDFIFYADPGWAQAELLTFYRTERDQSFFFLYRLWHTFWFGLVLNFYIGTGQAEFFSMCQVGPEPGDFSPCWSLVGCVIDKGAIYKFVFTHRSVVSFEVSYDQNKIIRSMRWFRQGLTWC